MQRHLGLSLIVIMCPFFAILAAYGWFGANCEDGFCGGLLWEMAVSIGVLAMVVAGVAWSLLRRGRGVGQAGGGAWLVAVAIGAVVFAASQAYERDVTPAAAGVAVALVAAIAAWRVARVPMEFRRAESLR